MMKKFSPLEKSKPQVIGDWERMKFKSPFFLTGFTLVELLISIAIVGIITTIMVVNFWREGQRGELRQTAEILASNLRKVQNMGMTGQSLSSGVPAGGFGVYLDSNLLSNNQYKLFGDKNGNGQYEPGNDEIISGGEVSLLRGRVKINIEKLCVIGASGACINSGSEVDITFKPPKPIPYTYYYDGLQYKNETGKTVEITLKQSNPVQCYKVTVVGASGQISDKRMASCPGS